MNFNKINYPTCPHCNILLNDLRIFDLNDLNSSLTFKIKSCLNCEKQFEMRTKLILETEVFKLED